jgi:hypothetical protein
VKAVQEQQITIEQQRELNEYQAKKLISQENEMKAMNATLEALLKRVDQLEAKK